VKISGNPQGGPLLDISTPTSPLTKGNLLQVAPCVAGDKAFGVTKWDTAAATTSSACSPATRSCRWSRAPRSRPARRSRATSTACRSRCRRQGERRSAVSGGAGGATVYIQLYK
jgi:hypothetical protein